MSAGSIGMFDEIPLQEVLSFLRSLPVTVFQVDKDEENGFYWLFYEGELAVEMDLDTEHLRGRRLSEVLPPNVPKDFVERLERCAQGEPQKEVYPWGDRWLKLYLRRSGNTSGDGTMAVDGAISDVSHRVRALLELKRINKDLEHRTRELESAHDHAEQLNYTLSHDLRNPLTVILSLCEVTRREIDSGRGDPTKRLEKIEQSAGRMNEMLTDILKLSRATRIEPDREEVDLSKLAEDVLKQMALSQPRREVDVYVEEGITVFAEPSLVRDLMENLLSNAWKYTKSTEHPRIEVRDERRGNERWVVVRDNGIGFRPEDKQELFKPFKRLGPATQFEGIGVGLATVERIVERHGGKLDAQGRPGEGATFAFMLPPPEEAPETTPEDLDLDQDLDQDRDPEQAPFHR